MPEGGSISDGVVHGTSDEYAVRELCDLDGGERVVVAGVRNCVVVGKKFLETIRNITKFGRVYGVDEKVLGLGVDKIDAGVVAEDVDIAGVVGDEAAGESGEMGEGEGEGVLEEDDEVVEGVRWECE